MNPPPISIEPSDVFSNVRKAYRLLHDYQCMVRDAVRYIGSQLDLDDNDGCARFAEDAVRGYRNLRQSPWAWLPMMFCEFHFVKTIGENDWLSLSFFVISDTGFFEGEGNDRENLADYARAEASSTKFAFLLRKGHWIQTLLPFMEDKAQMRNFIKGEQSLCDALGKAGFVSKCYDMSCICTPSEADKIVDDIIVSAQTKSWPVRRRKF